MDVVRFDESGLGWQKGAIVGIDVGSDKPFVYPINSKAGLHRYIDKIRRMYLTIDVLHLLGISYI